MHSKCAFLNHSCPSLKFAIVTRVGKVKRLDMVIRGNSQAETKRWAFSLKECECQRWYPVISHFPRSICLRWAAHPVYTFVQSSLGEARRSSARFPGRCRSIALPSFADCARDDWAAVLLFLLSLKAVIFRSLFFPSHFGSHWRIHIAPLSVFITLSLFHGTYTHHRLCIG